MLPTQSHQCIKGSLCTLTGVATDQDMLASDHSTIHLRLLRRSRFKPCLMPCYFLQRPKDCKNGLLNKVRNRYYCWPQKPQWWECGDISSFDIFAFAWYINAQHRNTWSDYCQYDNTLTTNSTILAISDTSIPQYDKTHLSNSLYTTKSIIVLPYTPISDT